MLGDLRAMSVTDPPPGLVVGWRTEKMIESVREQADQASGAARAALARLHDLEQELRDLCAAPGYSSAD